MDVLKIIAYVTINILRTRLNYPTSKFDRCIYLLIKVLKCALLHTLFTELSFKPHIHLTHNTQLEVAIVQSQTADKLSYSS